MSVDQVVANSDRYDEDLYPHYSEKSDPVPQPPNKNWLGGDRTSLTVLFNTSTFGLLYFCMLDKDIFESS